MIGEQTSIHLQRRQACITGVHKHIDFLGRVCYNLQVTP